MTKRTKDGKGMGDVLFISLVLDKESRMRLIEKTNNIPQIGRTET